MKNIRVIQADITELDVDIIVNAAKNTLLGGGGVDGIIHKKAGIELLEECKKLNGCETGNAKMTNAYRLPCKKIIHTVGPIYRGGIYNEDILLKSCYINSMLLAEQYRKALNLEKITIAFPCISTGIYRYPKEEACLIAIDTIEEIDNQNIDVIFVCFGDYDYELYCQNLYGKCK